MGIILLVIGLFFLIGTVVIARGCELLNEHITKGY